MLEITTTTATTVVEQKLQEFKTEFESLEINGVNDRPGYKKIQESAKTVREYRLDLQKKAKSVEAQINQIKKDFVTNAGIIIGGFQELEESLRAKLETIDKEKRMAKEAEKAAELVLFNTRTTELFSVGFTYNGQNYVAGAIYISPDDIVSMNDQDFEAFVKKGEAETERIKALIMATTEKNDPGPGPAMAANIGPVSEPHGIMLEFRPDSFNGDVENLKQPLWRENTPFDISPSTEKSLGNLVQAQPNLDAPLFPTGFTMGFDSCRKKVLEILDGDQKFTRDQLRELIIAIKYQ